MAKTIYSFFSPSLESEIGLDSLDQLSLEDLDTLIADATVELHSLKAEIRGKSALMYQKHTVELAQDIQALGIRRGALASILQQAQAKSSRARKQLNRQNDKQAAQKPTRISVDLEIARYFQHAAKQALDPATFQRILLIAEQRRAASRAKLNGMVFHADDYVPRQAQSVA